MIVHKYGDLLKADDCIAIVHQTNCLGVMGAGIAKQIKSKWYDEVYVPYNKECKEAPEQLKLLLGTIQVLPTYDSPINYVINAFGEYSFTESTSPYSDGRHTNYEALEQCLKHIKTWCEENSITSIGMPKYIGCGLAGGDWDGVVYPMIKKIFGGISTITLNIYEFKK